MPNSFKKFFLEEKIFYLLIFFLSAIVSFFYSNIVEQRAINVAITLSNQISQPDWFSYNYIASHSMWSLTFSSLKLFINLGININFLNFLILFICLYMNALGIYLISKSISNEKIFSILVTCVVVIEVLNFGNLDYPVVFISEHSNGMISQACCVLVFGLIANKKMDSAVLFSLITIGLNLVVGAWLISILLFSIFVLDRDFFKSFILKKKNIISLIVISLILLISFYDFYHNRLVIPYTYNHSLYTTYLEVWDHHRSSKNFGINYKYIFLTIFMSLAIIYLIKDKQILKKNNFFLKLVIFQVFFSFIIYFFYKVFPNLFQGIFLSVIPPRFFLIHSVFGVAIIISIIYLYSKILIKNKKIFRFILILIILYPFLYFNKYSNKIKIAYENSIMGGDLKDYPFWNSIKEIDVTEGVLLTSNNACSKTLQKAKKPILICIESIDGIPYVRKLAQPTKEIVEKIYEINFSNPPKKHRGGIWNDDDYKNVFEKRTYDQWIMIADEFKLKGLILPKEWNLQLDRSIVGRKFIYYDLKKN